jgi:hypothetical protein
MSGSFAPRLDILPDSQRALWTELDSVPSDFVLYGGTGLALQLGHRVSEDFDFFSNSGFDPDRLQSRLPFFRDLDTHDPSRVHYKRDNLEGFVERRGERVKVAFFGGLHNLQHVEDPRCPVGSRVRVASLVDLAGMKMRIIQVRGAGKITSISTRWQSTELMFYGDGTLSRVPMGMQQDLTRWAQTADLTKLPALNAQPGLTPEGLSR